MTFPEDTFFLRDTLDGGKTHWKKHFSLVCVKKARARFAGAAVSTSSGSSLAPQLHIVEEMGKRMTFRDKQAKKEKEMKELARKKAEKTADTPLTDAEMMFEVARGDIKTSTPAQDKVAEDGIPCAEATQKSSLDIFEPAVLNDVTRQVV